jgi:hypothetical protein
VRWTGHVARRGEIRNAYEMFPFVVSLAVVCGQTDEWTDMTNTVFTYRSVFAKELYVKEIVWNCLKRTYLDESSDSWCAV